MKEVRMRSELKDSICAVAGVRAAGIKEGKYGLALIAASGPAAAVFTSNTVTAESVRLMKERIENGFLDAVIVNSGNANVFTGEQGYRDAERMTEIAALELDTLPERVGVASTGVIGRYLDLDRIEDQCSRISDQLRADASAGRDAARAIMTTDTFEKHAIIRSGGFTVAGIAKGSGMIAPNMGTMLAFLYTDAEIEAEELNKALKIAVKRSFNRVVVDGDTSTNDCVVLTATGQRAKISMDAFLPSLEAVCIDLARQIAADGEGATKLLEVVVKGARTEDDAARVARTVVVSPLVKTAVYGRDPNWGRILMAVGNSGIALDPYLLTISLERGDRRIAFAENGRIIADERINPELLREAAGLMEEREVRFVIDLGDGDASATAWGCDLTEDYVKINGMYTT